MAKAVAVGGVFFKARDPKALAAWYAAQLGIQSADATSLIFDGPEAAGMTVFACFPQDTRYFGDAERSSPQPFMVNFRVDDLDVLLSQLAAAGVRIDPKREDHAYGRFAWIWDPEDNRIELWEPLPKP